MPARQHRVIAVAGDPGGAAALAPVLARLECEEGILLRSLAYRQAGEVWDRFRLRYETGYEMLGDSEAAELLAVWGADLVLCATSGAGEFRLEHRLTHAARLRRIPCVALLDFWSDYRARFADAGDRLFHLPDRIAVMDQQAISEMVEQGFPAERLIITGQPAFDSIESDRLAFTEDTRAQTRSSLGLGEKEKFVLFLSQPISAHYAANPNDPRYVGYTEADVHQAVIGALAQIAERRRQSICLLIRPHPRERMAVLNTHKAGGQLRVFVSADGGGRTLALAADLVAGMFTVLMMEAYLMGCSVVSLQPGLRVPDLLPISRSGLIPAVYDGDAMVPTLEKLLFSAPERSDGGILQRRTDATSKVVEVIRLALAQRRQEATAAHDEEHKNG